MKLYYIHCYVVMRDEYSHFVVAHVQTLKARGKLSLILKILKAYRIGYFFEVSRYAEPAFPDRRH